ncbi:MAG: hypothetical protein Q4D80_04525 [Pseudomonadota bacterium]|nr:hypothetical protein [Pseudomonadota bacterium]
MRITPLFAFSFVLSCLALPATTNAADDLFGDLDEEDTLFGAETAAESNKNTEKPKTLSAFISSRIPASSAKNIEKAEKVFCYTVEYAAKDYTGYTIDNLAITGSCGELSEEGRSLIKDMLLGNNLIFSSSSDRCDISPRILFRYINGIDSTDILLSAPCHSLTFYHGQDIISLNAAPGKNIIEQLVTTYSSLGEKFLSPALLGQVVPNGQVLTQDQKEIVRKISTTASPKKWGNTQPAPATENNNSSPQPVNKGWNKLK